MRSFLLTFILFLVSLRLVPASASLTTFIHSKSSAYKAPADSTIKKKLVKKLVDSFRFKKNFREKEEKRVISIINRLLLRDTLITAASLRALNKQLEDKEKQHYDTLLFLIQELSTNFGRFKDDAANAGAELPPVNPGISDGDIDNLVNKLVPILSEKAAEEKSEEEQREKLKRIRTLLASGGSITDTLPVNDSIAKKYSVRLSRRAEVYGFNPHWVKERYLNYNFNLLSNLIFYGYELDWKTGDYISLHGWDSSAAVTAAQRQGCKVSLAVFISNTQNIAIFLKNAAAQKKLARNMAGLIAARGANGIHIIFENLDEGDKDRFVRFIRYFSGILKKADSSSLLSISVPVIDDNLAYKVQDLNAYVDKFVIDFSKKNDQFPGPIAPLDGGSNSMVSGISLYLNKNIAPSKFIACLPYRGATWSKVPREFIEYQAYNEIKTAFGSNPVVYETQSATARMDFMSDGDTTEQMWFDDAKTLSKKYDYLLNNELGGAGIWALGYDNGYGELWNLLLEKFVSVDTFDVKILHLVPPKAAPLSLWGKIMRELREYRLILADPCHDRSKEFKSDDYIGYIAVFFLIALLVVSAIYIYNIRNKGDSWIWRKTALRVLIFLVIMVIISTFLYFFLNKNIPLVGLSDKSPYGCNPMPFSSLIIIISIGFISGLLVMRFLIIPLIRRDDMP